MNEVQRCAICGCPVYRPDGRLVHRSTQPPDAEGVVHRLGFRHRAVLAGPIPAEVHA